MFRNLEPERFERPTSALASGPAPQLRWLEVKELVVDGTYQREVGRRGAANVRHIAEHFDWSKFAPVIVASLEGGKFAIVDGQHRTTAAMLRGYETVPCQIVIADRAQQAAAYAAVNGSITKPTPNQLFHARLTAGESKAVAIQEVCAAAGVHILRRNIVQAKMQVGHTQAVGAIARCLRDYGRETLITALQCITQTGDGNPGFVRATIVEGLCQALHTLPEWRESGEQLLKAMDDFNFPDAWGEVTEGRDQIFPGTVRKLIAEKVRKHLSESRCDAKKTTKKHNPTQAKSTSRHAPH